jgi:hypothetical protein
MPAYPYKGLPRHWYEYRWARRDAKRLKMGMEKYVELHGRVTQ